MQKKILSALLMIAITGAFQLASADNSVQEYDLDLDRQPLEATLREFSRQTGLNTGYINKGGNSEDIIVGPLNGRYTAQAALRELLAKTGLAFVQTNDSSITVTKQNVTTGRYRDESVRRADQEISSTKAQFTQLADRALLAGAEPSTRLTTDEAPSELRWQDQRVDKRRDDSLDEIIVTGTRLKSKGLVPSPVTILDQERLEQLGVSNIADALTYLPQQSFSNNDNFYQGGARAVRLRGLGVGTTLVLINGRRTVTSALTNSFNFFDLNMIPLSSVERIEVLSDSASAIYGADAVGGVVNVILKTVIDRPVVDVYYGTSGDGADERRASVGFGGSAGRLRASMVIDAFDRQVLLGKDRDLSANRDFRRFGSLDRRSATANPGNITSLTSANLPGLPSRTTAVPIGSASMALVPASYLATAGQVNLGSTSRFSSVVPEASRLSGIGTVEIDVTEHISAFAEAMYVDRDDTRLGIPPSLANRTVPATNPYNPFGVPVAVSYLFTEVGPAKTITTSELMRGVGGARGTMGSWDWELSFLGTDEHGQFSVTNVLNEASVSAALSATDPALALNVFQDGSIGSPALRSSLVATPIVNNQDSKAIQSGGFLRGPVFELPTGIVDVAIGAETRSENIHTESRPAFSFSAERRTSAAYGEVRVPVLNWAPDTRAHRVTLTFAGRYDDYSDFGGTLNPQYGLEYNLGSSFLLRGSWGSSFRPPSLFELYQPPQTFTVTVADPRRGNENTPVSLLFAGNPALEPEEADSSTLGFVVDRRNLRVSVSYWKVEQRERVQRFGQNVVLANESVFPELVSRAAPTAADVAAGRPGRLLSINATTLNFGRLENSGVDLEATAELHGKYGSFSPGVSATWTDSYKAADLPNAPIVERVGIANSQGTIPEWRATASLAWNRQDFGLIGTARYTSAYDDITTAGLRNGRVIDAQTLLDVQGSIRLGELFGDNSYWSQGLVVRLGVMNVLDADPAFSEINVSGLDGTQADVRQRFGYITLSKSF